MPVAKLCILRNRFDHDFTLIELTVTIAIAEILLTVDIPSMRNLIIETRLSGNVNEFITVGNCARTEAIKRGRPVKICRSVNAESGANICYTKASGDNGSSDWGSGWIVIVPSGNNLVLLRQSAFSSKFYAQAKPTSRRFITYNSVGTPAGSFAGHGLLSVTTGVSIVSFASLVPVVSESFSMWSSAQHSLISENTGAYKSGVRFLASHHLLQFNIIKLTYTPYIYHD